MSEGHIITISGCKECHHYQQAKFVLQKLTHSVAVKFVVQLIERM